MLSPVEVDHGLVIRFDPAVLLAEGAAPTARSRAQAVSGVHYFICLGPAGKWPLWVPAFSRWLPGRVRVGYRAGSRDWVSQDAYVDLEQYWIVPQTALAPASAGVDYTRRGQRNLASLSFLYRDQLMAAG